MIGDKYPSKFYCGSGKGESEYELVAFDNALIDAGIANYNLVKVSSILPKNCTLTSIIDLEEGSALLTAFASISSDVPGDVISTSVAIGIPIDKANIGVIMEHSGHECVEESERIVTEMVKEAMMNHGIGIDRILVSAKEATVTTQKTCLISAVAFW